MARPKKLPDGMKLRGTTYYAWFRMGGRTFRKALSGDFKTACDILAEMKERTRKADFGIVDNNYPWGELVLEYLAHAKKKMRAGSYRNVVRTLAHFEQFGKVASMRQVTPAYIHGYREWRLAQKIGEIGGRELDMGGRDEFISAQTVNGEVSKLQAMLAAAVEWGKIAANPIADVHPLPIMQLRKQRRALTVEEFYAAYNAAPEWLKPMLMVFAKTGLRREELCGLLFSDIDFEARQIMVRASVAKNKKARRIPLDDETVEMFVRMKEAAKNRQIVSGKTFAGLFSRDHVFVGPANNYFRNNILRYFRDVFLSVGIEDARPGGAIDIHSLRVTFATISMEHGANPKAVQEILGHKTLAMTMGIYAKATDKSMRHAVGSLPFAAPVSAPEGVVSMPEAHAPRTPSNGQQQNPANLRISG